MRFETNPQLILTKEEFDTLDNALNLCQNMDAQTSKAEIACTMCPFSDKCSKWCDDCVYRIAHTALKQIIDIAIVK